MPKQKVSNLINAVEQSKVSDEEFATLKRLVEKRSRKAAQAQVTVTPVDTVQHSSPCSLNPDMPPDVCIMLESNEGKMDPELESPSAGTGPATPGQQCPPNKGTWEKGRTTADGFFTAGWVQTKGETFFPLRRKAWTREPVPKVRELLQTSLSCSRPTNPETKRKAAKRTISLTPVEKERRHRFETRL